MNVKETKARFLNITKIIIAGIIVLLFSAVGLFWHGNATSNQAIPALVAQVYFDGEYRISDGKWQKIEKGKHISSTEGGIFGR